MIERKQRRWVTVTVTVTVTAHEVEGNDYKVYVGEKDSEQIDDERGGDCGNNHPGTTGASLLTSTNEIKGRGLPRLNRQSR
jgi:hypothetical protein